METQNIKNPIYNYIRELRLAVRHPILKRDIGEVQVDNAKAFFLLLPMLNGEEWTESMNKAAIAVGAVHVAFDAHDTIELSDATSTEQQLTVLAGDFFSGVHYKLLASVPDIRFIRDLSSTIGQINEIKTNYHEQSPTTSKELLETIQMIEAGCIIQFLQSFGFSQYVPLVTAALPLFSLDPETKYSAQRTIQDILGWKELNQEVTQVITELRRKLDEAVDSATFITPLIKEEIRGMTAPLLGKTI